VVAFGLYGLTQAVLQIPVGYLSDRVGRKPVVALGLIIFGSGSIIAAVTDNIYILILGRFLQGGGAIASTCFAWVSDLTHESKRNMAMAFMGIAVGGSVVLGMILGPLIGGRMGVAFLFCMGAVFSLAGLYSTVWHMKEAPRAQSAAAGFGASPLGIIKEFSNYGLTSLNIAGFTVNVCMISTFFLVPLRLSKDFEMSQLWQVYVPLAVLGAAAMMICSSRADRAGSKKVITGSLMALAVAFMILFAAPGVKHTLAGFALFFAAFSILEAVLPAAVTKMADPENRGAIIGMFNLSQFMGTFVGGLLAGWLADVSESSVFLILAVGSIAAAARIHRAPKVG